MHLKSLVVADLSSMTNNFRSTIFLASTTLLHTTSNYLAINQGGISLNDLLSSSHHRTNNAGPVVQSMQLYPEFSQRVPLRNNKLSLQKILGRLFEVTYVEIFWLVWGSSHHSIDLHMGPFLRQGNYTRITIRGFGVWGRSMLIQYTYKLVGL